MYIGSFGGVIFTVSAAQVLTFQNMTRRTKHIFAEHKILNKVSKLESVGIEPIEFTFNVRLMKSLGVNVQECLNMWRETCRLALWDYLIIGGENLGLYVLESVEEEIIHTNGRGVPIDVNCKLQIKEYNFVGDF